MKRISLILLVIAATVGLAFSFATQSKERRPARYLVPEGYVGWVKINFRIKGAPAIPVEGNHHIFKFPPSGLLETSSDIEYGVAHDDYFYYCGDTRRKLESTGWDGGGMIWAGYSGWSGNNFAERTEVHEGFFVGTEEQLRKVFAEKDGNQRKVGSIDRSKLTCVAP